MNDHRRSSCPDDEISENSGRRKFLGAAALIGLTGAGLAAGCGSLAIDAQGRIDQRECLLCMDCMVLYYYTHACPPLSKERKHRERAGLPLTPISAKGYFISIVAEASPKPVVSGAG